MLRRPPRSTRTVPLFPYTTPFRSVDGLQARRQEAWETGDFKKAASLDDELLDYKLAAKERAKSGKPSVEVPEFKANEEPLSPRSEERRVGKECVSTCSSRGSRTH